MSLQFLLEENDEGISASFLYVDFLDLFNRVELLLSLLVADGCSELCLASREQSDLDEVVTIANRSSFISNVSI